jgi:hypothetical protein
VTPTSAARAVHDLGPAIRCWIAGWADLDNGLAHLVLAARATAGTAGPYYVRTRVHEWLELLDDDELDLMADALVDAARRNAV